MRTVYARRFSSVWHQALALVLALGMGLQGVPVESLLHAVDSSCVCAEQNYCPRNPDGDCACPHHGHEHGQEESTTAAESATPSNTPADGDRVVLRSCDTTGPEARAGVAAVKWLLPRVERTLRRSVVETERVATDGERASQRIGDDIFHPPWARSA